MSNMASTIGDLACIPNAIPAKERAGHFALARELLTGRVQERSDLANGYAFRFDHKTLASLVRFVENERKCCPFMTFEIVVSSGTGPIWLKLTGPAGTREVLQAELELSGSCGCNKGAQGSACSVPDVSHGDRRLLTWTAVGGIAAALGLCAACCLLPAVLISVGVTGAWVGSLDSLGAYKWIFVVLSATLLGFVYYRLYVKTGQGLRTRDIIRNDRLLRRMFWAGTALAVGGIAYGLMEPWFAR